MRHDLITVGRVNMDLHSQDIGAEFADVSGFDAMVGGSPTNIAIAASRLGLDSIAFTAVGEDRVGDFVLRFLRDAGVDTSYIPRKANRLTSLALLGIQPPDKFPLQFYREDPADVHLTLEDAKALPFADTKAIVLSGNAYSRGSCIDAATYCAEQAHAAGILVILDLDLRPSEWSEPTAYGRALAPILARTNVVIGTEEELYAALSPNPEQAMGSKSLNHSQLDELDQLVANYNLGMGNIVLKRGARGVTIVEGNSFLNVRGFDVTIVSPVGAGDSFASGLVYGRLQGWDWHTTARFANACGAIVVSRHGCATAFPTLDEVAEFVDSRGDL